MADRGGDADTTIAKTLAAQLAACKRKPVLLASELDRVIGSIAPGGEPRTRSTDGDISLHGDLAKPAQTHHG